MKYLSPLWKRSAGWIGISVASMVVLLFGCMDPEMGADPDSVVDDFYGGPGTYSTVSEPIEFTEEPYDFSGETTIGELQEIISENADKVMWYGFSTDDPYPVDGDCDPHREPDSSQDPEDDWNWTQPEYFDELPAEIEGVVTLHPRYFQNVTVCGSRERNQGSFVIQDETAGIQVIRDSRVAEYDVGDRVRMRVRSLVRNFDTHAILGFDEWEIVNDRDDREPVYFEELEREFDADVDKYEVRRITGRVTKEPTNQNFNEMFVESVDDPDIEWFVSLDREIGRRGVGPKEGEVVQLTGPVIDSFGLRMIVASLGQIEVIEEVDED